MPTTLLVACAALPGAALIALMAFLFVAVLLTRLEQLQAWWRRRQLAQAVGGAQARPPDPPSPR
jgi:hypothetical protein